MKVNSVYGLLLAVQSGAGLAALPDYIAHNISELQKFYLTKLVNQLKLILFILLTLKIMQN